MKVKIVKSSELDNKCLSPLRYLNGCHECDRVMACELPQARVGKIRKLNKRIIILQGQLKYLKLFRDSLIDNG